MKRSTVVALLMAMSWSLDVLAQQSCVCTNGCRIIYGTIPADSPAKYCSLYVSPARWIAVGSFVAASSVAVMAANDSICAPADPPFAYNIGDQACIVRLPPQPVGSVSVYMTLLDSGYVNERTAIGQPLTFNNVTALPAPPPTAPYSYRVTTP